MGVRTPTAEPTTNNPAFEGVYVEESKGERVFQDETKTMKKSYSAAIVVGKSMHIFEAVDEGAGESRSHASQL